MTGMCLELLIFWSDLRGQLTFENLNPFDISNCFRQHLSTCIEGVLDLLHFDEDYVPPNALMVVQL
jgi:hypothetical protein